MAGCRRSRLSYEAGGAERFEALLRLIAVSEATTLPRRFVSLTWIVPSFMEWQIERVLEKGGDVEALKQDITKLRNVLNDLLGAP
jgi:hypothetical protein